MGTWDTSDKNSMISRRMQHPIGTEQRNDASRASHFAEDGTGDTLLAPRSRVSRSRSTLSPSILYSYCCPERPDASHSLILHVHANTAMVARSVEARSRTAGHVSLCF